MKVDRIYPETLQQLILEIMQTSQDFKYIRGVQPFLVVYKNKQYYIYVKNLSSAYFSERPDTTRAQLPIKDDFEEIKKSASPFVFLGYDQNTDVLVCWNYHIVKQRHNAAKSVSFYSRKFYQEEVSEGEFLRKKLKNGDEPILFKRKDLIRFFDNIDNLFNNPRKEDGVSIDLRKQTEDKITEITDEALLALLKPLLDSETPHTLEAITVAERFYHGKYPKMRLRDWAALVKTITYKDKSGTSL
jgi:hypothetical protein